MNIALITCNEIPNGTADDQILQKTLASRNHTVDFKIWSDPTINWSEYNLCIIRSAWDYHQKFQEFLSWSQKVTAYSKLLNPIETIIWNGSKKYLLELQKNNNIIVPTLFENTESTALFSIEKLLNSFEELVIKPIISATSDLTYKIKTLSEAEAHLGKILERGEVLIQPYLKSVTTEGEKSLIFYYHNEWIYSHSVLKKPQFGDYRVQSEFGGVAIKAEADQSLINLAIKCLQSVPKQNLYARVDFLDFSNSPKIGEVELIEPELFFRFSDSLAENITKALF